MTSRLCCLLLGTRTLTSFDGAGAAEHGESLFLLAVKESTVTGHQLEKTYGVCLIDTCEGTFHVRDVYFCVR